MKKINMKWFLFALLVIVTILFMRYSFFSNIEGAEDKNVDSNIGIENAKNIEIGDSVNFYKLNKQNERIYNIKKKKIYNGKWHRSGHYFYL